MAVQRFTVVLVRRDPAVVARTIRGREMEAKNLLRSNSSESAIPPVASYTVKPTPSCPRYPAARSGPQQKGFLLAGAPKPGDFLRPAQAYAPVGAGRKNCRISMIAKPAKDDTKACVLVVNDEAMIRSALTRILNDADFNVTTAQSGREALGMLETKQFDAIVTDIMMPEMDGMELLSRVRQRDRELPVIILTGHPTLDSAIIAVREASFRYLKKPFAPEELCDTVREAAAMYRLAVLKRLALENFESSARPKNEPTKLSEQFDSALAGLWMAYQPIIDWPDKSLFGYEALVRTTGSALSNPGLLFDAAEQLGRVQELGRQIRRAVAGAVHEAPPGNSSFRKSSLGRSER